MKHQMSKQSKIMTAPSHFYDCLWCNYSKISSSAQHSKLAMRLHEKVCKQTGRTEDGVKVTDVRHGSTEIVGCRPMSTPTVLINQSSESTNP